jgi:nucleoid-associated protein YgaU
VFDLTLTIERAFGTMGCVGRTRVRWGRITVAVATVAFTVSGLAGRAGAGASGSTHRLQRRTHVVHAGDTLWGIASELVGPQEDPRPVVDRLASANHVEAGLIHVGDVLVVPPG